MLTEFKNSPALDPWIQMNESKTNHVNQCAVCESSGLFMAGTCMF